MATDWRFGTTAFAASTIWDNFSLKVVPVTFAGNLTPLAAPVSTIVNTTGVCVQDSLCKRSV
jgi:hypothetical protein